MFEVGKLSVFACSGWVIVAVNYWQCRWIGCMTFTLLEQWLFCDRRSRRLFLVFIVIIPQVGLLLNYNRK